MDIKAYIDYFDEISTLPREQQFEHLAAAQRSVESAFPLPVFTSIAIVARILMIGLLGLILVTIADFAVWVVAIAVVGGLLLARVIISEVNTHLLRKHLKNSL